MITHARLHRSFLAAAILTLLACPAFAAFEVTSATALPATVSEGKPVAMALTVASSVAASNTIVDLEIYDAAGTRVGQTYYQTQNFSAAKAVSYDWSYAAQAAGKYTVTVGVFTAGWSSLLYWNSAAASFAVAAPANTTNRGTVPAGLPSTFFIGLSAQPGTQTTWVHDTGIPWAICYQYISSGVLPSQTWATHWGNDFAYDYAVSAHAAGCIPEFDYYQLVPTIGAQGAAAEDSALNNASIMADYFKDLTTLLKQLHQYGGKAVVHVEPDMWGFLETLNTNPALLKAAVASSGNADVGAYPNTIAGFGRALLHLRDLYAPNVIMAAHVSTWMWSLSTDSSLDVTAIAQTDAKFMTETGTWDLFYTDISDRDAAYYQDVVGDGGAHWWDTRNEKYPNFNRLNVWAGAFTAAAEKRLVIWQVPVGNTLMRSCDNTNFHYQDNRQQYWLENYPNNSNIGALAKAGVIGLLFGPGNSGTTDVYDAAGDGITNPAAIDGNTTVSVHADDDGGLLRLNVANYYRSGAAPLP
jgi:hypothetical protein